MPPYKPLSAGHLSQPNAGSRRTKLLFHRRDQPVLLTTMSGEYGLGIPRVKASFEKSWDLFKQAKRIAGPPDLELLYTRNITVVRAVDWITEGLNQRNSSHQSISR